MTEHVLHERLGSTTVITLNRPEARNAMTAVMESTIASLLTDAQRDPAVRAVVITGTGKAFCAGADLRANATKGPMMREVDAPGFGGYTWNFIDKPTIAAVNGFALGGGMELCLASDLVVAGEDAVFGLPEVKRGIVAGADGMHRLARQMPPKVAFDYLFTGRFMDAATAERWGLVSRLVPAGQALVAALALADEIAANAPLAVSMTKRVAHAAYDGVWSDDVERHRFTTEERNKIMTTEDAHEGALAFTEKRAPNWTGR